MGKRDDILDSALDIISEDGLQSLTFSKIFKKANTGAGTFYNYFDNKHDLCAALFERCSAMVFNSMSATDDPDMPVYQRFKAIAYSLVDFGLNYPKELDFLNRYMHNPMMPESLKGHHMPASMLFQSIIADGQRQGLIHDTSPLLIGQIASGMITSVTRGYIAGEYELGEGQIAQLVESTWKAVRI